MKIFFMHVPMRIVALLLIIVVSCNRAPGKLSKTQLANYIHNKKNGLMQEQDVNGITVSVSYQPSSMLVMQELDAEQRKDASQIAGAEKKYQDHFYFLLRFSKNGKEAIRQLGSFSRYSDMVQVLSFQMARFVNMTTPQRDTVQLADYLFDQTYGMNSGNTVLLSFDKTKVVNSDELEINIGECGFGTGALKFSIKKEDIDRLPQPDYGSL
jgi:hypothetical protein